MDSDEIVNKRVHAIARAHSCSIDDVHAALDRHPMELDELQQAFRDKALEDRDVAAGVLLIKVAERRATLLGLNAPIGHAVQVIQHDPPNKPTSTERIRAAIDRIRGKTQQDDLPSTEQDDPPSTH